MARYGPWKNAYLAVNGVDLSDHAESISLNTGAVTLSNSAMGDEYEYQRAGLLNWSVYQRAGLLNWSVEATFYQDFAAGSVDATLWPLYSGRQTFALVLRADSGLIGTANPQWSGDVFISSYQPAQGAHGDNLMSPVTFSPASDLLRSTS
jgi:hypothetical protein